MGAFIEGIFSTMCTKKYSTQPGKSWNSYLSGGADRACEGIIGKIIVKNGK